MQSKEFLDKVDLDALNRRLISELNVNAEFKTDDLSSLDGQFSLEMTTFTYFPGMKIAERIDFEIFTRLSRFDCMTVTFPRNCLTSRVDRLVEISKIVEDHIGSALNS